MADYAATNTARFRATQTGPRGTHHMIFRIHEASDATLSLPDVELVLTEMLLLCLDGTHFPILELAAIGSDVFLPMPGYTAHSPAATGAAATALDEYGRYVNFVGRTLAGSRVSWYLFNVLHNTGTANNRMVPAENANLASILAVLNGTANSLSGIDQTSFIMKGYANTGIHDRVAKKSRLLV